MAVDWALTFEVAFDVDPGDEPDPGDWVDLSGRLIDTAPASVVGPRGLLLGLVGGTASLTLDNSDRGIDPTNSSATYNLVPLRHARLIATVDSTDYPIFRGYVEAWPPTWTGFDSVVQVSLVDAFVWLALQNFDLDRPAELSSDRVTALLDAAGWPAGLRDIDLGLARLDPIEAASVNALLSLQDVVRDEQGDLYVAPDGTVTFRSRHARLDGSVVATFGPDDVPFMPLSPTWDATRLTNIAVMQQSDGTVITVTKPDSVAAYGPRSMPIRDLALDDVQADALGRWEVVRFSEPSVWLDGLTATSVDDVLPTCLPLRIGDLVRVVHTPPAGAGVDINMVVEQCSHEIRAAEWLPSFALSPDFYSGPWLRFDDDTVGFDVGGFSP